MSRAPKEADFLMLFGGGLDSAAMVVEAQQRNLIPLLFYIDYGAKAREGELASLHYFARRYGYPLLVQPLFGELYRSSPLLQGAMATDHAKNYIPGRNLLFFSLGLSMAASKGLVTVWAGLHREPPGSLFADAELWFAHDMNELVIKIYGERFPNLEAPFGMREQKDYLLEALKIDSTIFERSFSCYESSTAFECGRCTHCTRKAALLETIRDAI